MNTEELVHTADCEDLGVTCIDCKEHQCEDPGDWQWTRNSENLCAACYESDLEYASTVLIFEPGASEPERWTVGSHVVFDQYGDPLSDHVSRVYHRTDAWRGYYETEVSGTVEVKAGADLWGESTSVRELAERIQEESKEGLLPVTVYVVIDLTSNVFATAMTIRVKEKDLATFEAWRDGELGEGEEE